MVWQLFLVSKFLWIWSRVCQIWWFYLIGDLKWSVIPLFFFGSKWFKVFLPKICLQFFIMEYVHTLLVLHISTSPLIFFWHKLHLTWFMLPTELRKTWSEYSVPSCLHLQSVWLLQELERQLAAKEASLPQEPASDDENAVTLLVRMPDGSRHGRRFLKSDKLQVNFTKEWFFLLLYVSLMLNVHCYLLCSIFLIS